MPDMDILSTTEPKSDQQNFDDYIGGSKTVTVSGVKVVSGEQPVEIHLVEFPGRPFKPGKSMRRVLVAGWGSDSSKYAGRTLTLYGDPSIRFGKEQVGGIRISHLSHISKPLEISLTVTRGKRQMFTVQPLAAPDNSAVTAAIDEITGATSLPTLKAAWDIAGKKGVQGHPDVIAAKDARKLALTSPADEIDPASPEYVEPTS